MKRRGIIRFLTLNCREAAELLSADLDRSLTRGERLSLRAHVLICSACRRFGAQVRTLRTVLREADLPEADAPDASLTDAARARIRDGLRAAR